MDIYGRVRPLLIGGKSLSAFFGSKVDPSEQEQVNTPSNASFDEHTNNGGEVHIEPRLMVLMASGIGEGDQRHEGCEVNKSKNESFSHQTKHIGIPWMEMEMTKNPARKGLIFRQQRRMHVCGRSG